MSMFQAIFGYPKAEKVRQEQLEEAQRMALAHQASAEYHAAMASMYKQRVTRLQSEIQRTKNAEQQSSERVAPTL